MHDFEVQMKKYMAETNSSSTSWVGEILKEIAHAADQLQDSVAGRDLSEDEVKVVFLQN